MVSAPSATANTARSGKWESQYVKLSSTSDGAVGSVTAQSEEPEQRSEDSHTTGMEMSGPAGVCDSAHLGTFERGPSMMERTEHDGKDRA